MATILITPVPQIVGKTVKHVEIRSTATVDDVPVHTMTVAFEDGAELTVDMLEVMAMTFNAKARKRKARRR